MCAKSWKTSHYPHIEQVPMTCVIDRNANSRLNNRKLLRMFGEMVVAKAYEMLSDNKKSNLFFSNGWWTCSTQRNNLRQRRVHEKICRNDRMVINQLLPQLF